MRGASRFMRVFRFFILFSVVCILVGCANDRLIAPVIKMYKSPSHVTP